MSIPQYISDGDDIRCYGSERMLIQNWGDSEEK